MRTRLMLILIFVAVFLLAAYAYLTKGKFDVSVPQKDSSSMDSKVENENISIEKNNVQISMQIQNYTQNSQPPYSPLGLWINVKPLGTGLSLDPAQILLSVDGKDPIKSSVYLGPSNSWESPRSLGKGCGPQRHSWGWALSKVDVYFDELKAGNPSKALYLTKDSKPVSLNGEACFMFFFDTDTSPNHQFSVSVRELKDKTGPIVISDVSFKKGTVTKTTLWP